MLLFFINKKEVEMSSNDAIVVLQYKKGSLPHYRVRYMHAFENIFTSYFFLKEAFDDEPSWPIFSLAKYDAEQKYHEMTAENGFEPEYGIVLVKKFKDMTWDEITDRSETEFKLLSSEQPFFS